MTFPALALDEVGTSGAPTYSAGQFRLALSGLFTPSGALGVRSGILNAESWAPSISGSTLTVAPGRAVVQGATTTTQGAYLAAMPTSQTLTIPAASATYARWDLVYVRVWDNEVDSSGLTQADIVYLAGTPAASPSLPSIPAGQTGLKLIQVTVPASGGGSPTAQIVGPYTAARGGVVPVYSATDEATLTEPGQLSLRLDTGRVRRLLAGTWSDVADRHWCRVSKTGTFNLGAGATVAIIWDGAVNSPGDSMGAVGSSSLTAPVTGDYNLTASVLVPGAASGALFVYYEVNGANQRAIAYSPGSSGGQGLTGAIPLGLNAGDTVTVLLYSAVAVTGWANPTYARLEFVGPSS